VNKVEKMGSLDVSNLVNKYLEKPESKEKNFIDNNVSQFDEKASSSRDHAVIRLKNGQKIEVQEGSLLYEKVKDYSTTNFLRIDADRFLNPSEISEFIDIDSSIDYSTKDVLKEEVEVADQNWREVFYPDGEE
jgi:hypothetical protein